MAEDHDCAQVLREVYHFLDGEIDDSRREIVAHHLDCCSHCLEAFEFEYELKAAIRVRCHEEVPSDLLERIRTVIDSDGAS